MSAHSEDFLKLAAEARKNIQEVSPEEVRNLADRGALLLDVREKEEFREGTHLAGAVNLSRGILEMRIHEHAGKEDTIVCYCAGGNRGALAADSLRRLGYRNVSSIHGGLNACAPDQLEDASPRKASTEAGR